MYVIEILGDQVSKLYFEKDRLVTKILHAKERLFSRNRDKGLFEVKFFSEEFFNLGTEKVSGEAIGFKKVLEELYFLPYG